MEKVIVYLDDAAYARAHLPAVAEPTHWLLVACAPRMTHRISKWVSHSARENWRTKWADKLFDQVLPPLRERGDHVTPILAKGPLPELTRALIAEHGEARVVDARRPKSIDGGDALRWSPGPILGFGAFLLCSFAGFDY
ncbi:hypothetical protein [Ramlibacter sp. AN1133]|uniref:hypothetical protein n=1 Tax=Ramlibacter sp. AN1133 TaxID=3133429 RepID=UPI0030BF14AB